MDFAIPTENTALHRATTDLIFARASGAPGDARGITAFLVPIREVAGHRFGAMENGRKA
jgi:hypothetical protein